MGILIGFVVTLGCVLGGFMAMGGHLDVLMQPWELVIIGGAAVGQGHPPHGGGRRRGPQEFVDIVPGQTTEIYLKRTLSGRAEDVRHRLIAAFRLGVCSIERSLEASSLLLEGDMDRALQKIHAQPQRPKPPRPAPPPRRASPPRRRPPRFRRGPPCLPTRCRRPSKACRWPPSPITSWGW